MDFGTQQFNTSSLNGTTAVNGIPEATYNYLFVFIVFISSFGIPSNLLVTAIFLKLYRKNSSTVHLLIASTTISDLLMISFAGPVHAYMYYQRKWTFGKAGCTFYGFWVHLTSVASLTHLTILSVERYHIVKHNKQSETRPLLAQLFLALLAWVYATFWAILPLFGWSEYVEEGLDTGCAPKWVSRALVDVTYNLTLIIVEFLIPIIIIIVAYVKLVRKLDKHSKSISRQQTITNAVKKGQFVQKKTMFMVIVMLGAFLFCWLPYVLVCLWVMLVGESKVSPVAAAVPSLLAKTCSIWNPLIYGVKHTSFRKEIIKIWTRLRGKRNNTVSALVIANTSRGHHLKD